MRCVIVSAKFAFAKAYAADARFLEPLRLRDFVKPPLRGL
jgi:hypothetical protein